MIPLLKNYHLNPLSFWTPVLKVEPLDAAGSAESPIASIAKSYMVQSAFSTPFSSSTSVHISSASRGQTPSPIIPSYFSTQPIHFKETTNPETPRSVSYRDNQKFVDSVGFLTHGDDHDYEDEGLTYGTAMVAGAVAGVSEHMAMFPVDTIKTRMQANRGERRYRNVFDAVRKIIQKEGPLRLYRGITAIAMGAIPSHAVYFATYEKMKDVMGTRDSRGHHPLENGFAGACATVAHDAVVTPLDVVKQRLQIAGTNYSGVLQCARSIVAKEGFRAFYASFPPTLAMNIPFQSVYFASYESFKTFLSHDETGEHGPMEEIVAGGMAGALGGFVSNPVDVVKTRIQTTACPLGTYRESAIDVVKDIYNKEGYRGFTRGIQARVLYFIPSAAICWTTYETMKRVLGAEPQDHH